MNDKLLKLIEVYKVKTQKECYRVEYVKEEPDILDNKIGGKPYLPVGVEYPKDKNGEYMPLLLQVNLKDIDWEGYPKNGILEIFIDKNLSWPCDYVIKFFKEGLEYQTIFPFIDLENFIVREALKINLFKDICHMPESDYRFIDTIISIIKEMYNVEVENIDDISDFFEDEDWQEKFYNIIKRHSITIGGYADFTQSDPRDSINSDMEECLFKLDSNEDFNLFLIGDCGILFALISKKALKDGAFDKGIIDWDCY